MAGLPTHPLGGGSAVGGVNYDPFFRGAQMEQGRQMFNADQREQAKARAAAQLLAKTQAQKQMVVTLAQLKQEAEQAKMQRETEAQKAQSAETARAAQGARADREIGLREREIGLREEDRNRDDQFRREAFDSTNKRKQSEASGQAAARQSLGANPTDEQIAAAYEAGVTQFPDDPVARDAYFRAIEQAEGARARAMDTRGRAAARDEATNRKRSEDTGRTKAREMAGTNPTLESVANAATKMYEAIPDDPAAQAAFSDELGKLRSIAEVTATRQQKAMLAEREARSKQVQRYTDAIARVGAERAKTTASRRTGVLMAEAELNAAKKIHAEIMAKSATGQASPAELNNSVANLTRASQRVEQLQSDVRESERLSGEPERLKWLQDLQNWVQNGGDFPRLPEWIMEAANR